MLRDWLLSSVHYSISEENHPAYHLTALPFHFHLSSFIYLRTIVLATQLLSFELLETLFDTEVSGTDDCRWSIQCKFSPRRRVVQQKLNIFEVLEQH